MGNVMSAAYRFAKQYDCMDMPNAHDPSNGDAAPGTFDSASNSEAGTRDMVATLDTVKPVFKDFEGKNFPRAFVLGKTLGEGSFATVFKGTVRGSPAGSKPYAIKRTVRQGLAEEDREAVFEEVRILRTLQHPNVVSIYQFYQDDPDYYYMVLEYMAGGELFDRIVQKAYYNEKEARDLCRILISGVKYCHDLGVVHRDLKPENLLLSSPSDSANIKLADFGLACSVLGGNVSDQCGSPGYVAPEILRGAPYGTPVDMWSIGVIIYTLLGGYPPFHDENQTRLFRRIKAGSFKFHDEYWSNTSDHAKDLIRKLLLVDERRRMTARDAVHHPWLLTTGQSLASHNLGKNLEQLRIFNATRKLRGAIRSVIAAKQMARGLQKLY